MIFKKYFQKEDARSLKVIKNISGSFIIKGFSIVINLLLVPLTIHYLTSEKFGIWLTISSLFTWISFFDIGLGHGLRNKLAEAIAKNEVKRAKALVSTAYISIAVLCIFLFIVFSIVNNFLNWNVILNTPSDINENFKLIAFILFSTFSIQFVLQLINSILLSTQQSYRVSLYNACSNLLILTTIFILTKYSAGSLMLISFVFTVIPVLVMVVVNIYYFKKGFKDFSPSFKNFDFTVLKDVLSLGLKFFLIQVSALVFYETTNLLISQYFSPEMVTPYNIAYRYFGIITMIFSILSSPYWSAYTEAYAQKDYNWMTKSIKKMLKMWVMIFAMAIIMLLFSKTAYRLWVGDKVKIDFKVSLFMMIYNSILTFGNIFVMVINGTGRIKLQMIIGIIGMIIFIPLSYLLAVYFNLGLIGIILSTIICSLYGTLVAPFEVKKIFSQIKAQIS
ncbi:MAG: oligosaccharide flippase family protein [Bacteroidia bacterium]